MTRYGNFSRPRLAIERRSTFNSWCTTVNQKCMSHYGALPGSPNMRDPSLRGPHSPILPSVGIDPPKYHAAIDD